MCPPVPASLLRSIDARSTDEELVLFLERRRVGDPIPSNVIIEENPFSIEPWDSPEGMWYLYNTKDLQSRCKGSIIETTKNGYWRSMDDLKIITSTPTVGIKTTREFYIGQAPSGDRSVWLMHEYQAGLKAHRGNNTGQDYSCLCRVFLQNDQMRNHGEQSNSLSLEDADGEYVESMLLSLLEQEENSSLRDAAKKSQVADREEQRQPSVSSTGPQNLVNDHFPVDMNATYEFSKGDYLELKDLCSLESSSSSSDNSSLMSLNSDECFDAEALLRDIENDSVRNMEEERVDCRFSLAASVKTNQVVIRPPPPGSILRNNSNLKVKDSGTANTMPGKEPPSRPALSLSIADLWPDGSALTSGPNGDASTSTSGSSQGSVENQIHSGSSQGGRTQRSGSKSRIAKLGKRYWCFGSF